MENEQELVKRAQQGDPAAFEELVVANQKKIYTLALRMSGNEQDALELSQEVFLRAYRSLGSFRSESSFSTWLYRMTSNICIDFLRREKKRQTVAISSLDENGEDQFIDLPGRLGIPDDELEKKEFTSAVEDALLKLSPDHRQIFIMREINGLSYLEIARALDLEEGTVKSRIARARLQMRKKIDGNFYTRISSDNDRKE